jgi:hypothetical protein
MQENNGTYSKERIFNDVVGAINDLNSGSQVPLKGSIAHETMLGAELGLRSLDLVRLIASIQQLYAEKVIPFQDMFVTSDGSVLEDIRMSHVVSFLYDHLNS